MIGRDGGLHALKRMVVGMRKGINGIRGERRGLVHSGKKKTRIVKACMKR